MSRANVVALMAAPALALLAASALAQLPQVPGRQGRITDKDVEMCDGAPGGSRVRTNCEAGATAATARSTQEFKAAIEPRAQTNAPPCEVNVVTNYVQRNTTARVSGNIDVEHCPAGSTGAYNVLLRVKDASGEIKPLEFNETWQSSDVQDVKFAADYPIGRDVELLNVRVRNVRCTCVEPQAAPAQASAAPSGE